MQTSAIVFLLVVSAIPALADELPLPFEWTKPRLVWQTPSDFQTPEAVLYDKKRKRLYVSNYRVVDSKVDGVDVKRAEFLSRLETSGEVLEMRWVTGLENPTGMTIHEDCLYVVERDNLAQIEIDSGKITRRIPIHGADFPNDVVFDKDGNGYISDNGENAQHSVFRLQDGKILPWLSTALVVKPNGLFAEENCLVAYDKRRRALVSIDYRDQKVRLIANLKSNARAMGDGLVRLDSRSYLVTAWEGPSWVVQRNGQVVPLLDTNSLTPTKGRQVNNADCGFVAEKKLWIIPTFFEGRILAYSFQ